MVWKAFIKVIDGYIANIEEFQRKTKIEDAADASLAIHALYTLSDTISFLRTGDDGFIGFMIAAVEEQEV